MDPGGLMVRTAVFLCLFAVAAPSGAGDRLAMRLSPAVAGGPGGVTRQPGGEEAPRLNVFQFRTLPTGTYEVTSVLVGAAGERAAVSRMFRVAPATGSP